LHVIVETDDKQLLQELNIEMYGSHTRRLSVLLLIS